MKKKVLALWAALLLLSLTACGGNGSGGMKSADQTAPSVPMESPAQNADFSVDSGWNGAPSPEPAAVEEIMAGGSGLPANTKVIYTAEINLETKDFDSASQELADLVNELEGYFESRDLSQGGVRRLTCTIRVPAKNFTALLDRAGETAHVTSRSEYLEDVSEAYYDQEVRLTTQRTKLDRLHELLSKAESMEDIIALETAISDTELQIEYLTGSLRKYDSLIGYSTITLYLQEVYRLSTDEEVPVTFGQRLGAAFSTGLLRGVEGLEDFAISIARNWVSLLILAAIAAAAVLAFRRSRRRRAARMAPPAEGGAAQSPEKGEDTDKK